MFDLDRSKFIALLINAVQESVCYLTNLREATLRGAVRSAQVGENGCRDGGAGLRTICLALSGMTTSFFKHASSPKVGEKRLLLSKGQCKAPVRSVSH